jgi:hypothetical protein
MAFGQPSKCWFWSDSGIGGMLTDVTNNCVVGHLLPSGEYLITPETKADFYQRKGATPFTPLTNLYKPSHTQTINMRACALVNSQSSSMSGRGVVTAATVEPWAETRVCS